MDREITRASKQAIEKSESRAYTEEEEVGKMMDDDVDDKWIEELSIALSLNLSPGFLPAVFL